jgi:hypothetical protein
MVFGQQKTVLFLERLSAMMSLLVIDVSIQLLQLTPADGKIAVASLPEKAGVLLALPFDPGGGCFLDLLQEFGLADSAS